MNTRSIMRGMLVAALLALAVAGSLASSALAHVSDSSRAIATAIPFPPQSSTFTTPKGATIRATPLAGGAVILRNVGPGRDIGPVLVTGGGVTVVQKGRLGKLWDKISGPVGKVWRWIRGTGDGGSGGCKPDTTTIKFGPDGKIAEMTFTHGCAAQ